MRSYNSKLSKLFTKDFLINLYWKQNKNTVQIAKDFNCTYKNILYYMKKYKIPRQSSAEARKGIPKSVNFKKRLSMIKIRFHKNHPNILKGKNNPMYGKKHSFATRKKMSKAHRDVSGKNNPNYIHGLSNTPYPLEFNEELKLQIRDRDNHKCQLCGMTEEEHLIIHEKVLCVHHIDYNKKNCKKENLISLCNDCNCKVNYNIDYYYAYFTYIMKGKYAIN